MLRGTLLVLLLGANLVHAQVGSRLSGLRDTTLPGLPNATVGAAVLQPSRADGINNTPQPTNAVSQPGTGGTDTAGPRPNGNGTVNGVEYRTTAGGTYLPGYSPAGGVVFGGVGVDGPRQQEVRPPPPDLSLEQKITHVEALDGLTYGNTIEIENTIRRFQLVDSAKVLSEPERLLLRQKILDNPVATGSQNLLSRFLRAAELIQSHHVVVGVVPRKNLILIGLRSSEEG